MSSKFNHKVIQILKLTIWIGFFAAVVGLMGFVNIQKKNQPCTGIEIAFTDPLKGRFVQEKELRELLFNAHGVLIGKPGHAIDLSAIESMVEKQNGIENAEVYIDLDGKLNIEVQQVLPVARVILQDGTQGYLDRKGKWMNWSKHYTPRVIVVNGYVPDFRNQNPKKKSNFISKNELLTLISTLQKDDFLQAQIEQIYINQRKEVVLIPRVGRHEILFGSVDDMETKFDNLRIFYAEGISKVDWNRYKSVDLRFKDQVVCTKRE
jgi:cell division protein FtsQ